MTSKMRDTEVSGPEPLTVVASWKVKPGKESAFEQWHHGMSAEAMTFPGHLGVSIIRPSQGGGEYHVLFKFDSSQHLTEWLNSDIRKIWLAKADLLKADETRYHTGHGLEFWFTLSTDPQDPPRWKMAIVTVLGVWPVSLLVPWLLSPLLVALPMPLQALLVAIGIVILLTWVVMPVLVKILTPWLHNRSKER